MSFFCLASSVTVLSCLSLGMCDAHSCDVHIFISSHDALKTAQTSSHNPVRACMIHRSTILGFWNSLPGVAFFQCQAPVAVLFKFVVELVALLSHTAAAQVEGAAVALLHPRCSLIAGIPVVQFVFAISITPALVVCVVHDPLSLPGNGQGAARKRSSAP